MQLQAEKFSAEEYGLPPVGDRVNVLMSCAGASHNIVRLYAYFYDKRRVYLHQGRECHPATHLFRWVLSPPPAGPGGSTPTFPYIEILPDFDIRPGLGGGGSDSPPPDTVRGEGVGETSWTVEPKKILSTGILTCSSMSIC